MLNRFVSQQLLLFFTGFLLTFTVTASTHGDQVDRLLAMAQAPAGVVFEIASGDAKALQWAIPQIQQYTQTLRKKFPGLDVAVVTHGREQFALQTTNQGEYQKVHDSVKDLSTKDNVPVHICQTFASWNGVEAEDFPEYVTVSTTGPQQVNDYIDLGYTLIKLRRQ